MKFLYNILHRQKDFPGFIHHKKYDYYYLFDDSEIIGNRDFRTNVILFSKKIGGNSFLVELRLTKDLKSIISDKFIRFSNNLNDSNNLFWDKSIEIRKDNGIFISYLDFIMTDETSSWELCCSSCYELGIIGCNQNVVNDFIEIIAPYKNKSFELKINSIGDFFKYHKDKYKFIKRLQKNYKFQVD